MKTNDDHNNLQINQKYCWRQNTDNNFDDLFTGKNDLKNDLHQKGKCNNFSARAKDSEIKYIVQHHTVGDLYQTIENFTQFDKASSHYLINTDGAIYQLVDDKYKAWHAGGGEFSDHSVLNPYGKVKKNSLNSFSIGIENVNTGNEPFTEAQITSNLKLTQYLCVKYNIRAENVIHHSDWAPGRKIDPSPYWPTQDFAKNGCGLYWHGQNISQDKIQQFSAKVANAFGGKVKPDFKLEFLTALRQYGYKIDSSDIRTFYDEGKFSDPAKYAILSFKIKFCGAAIIADKNLLQTWEDLCKVDPNDKDRRDGYIDKLIQVEEDDLEKILSIIDSDEQYKDNGEGEFWAQLKSENTTSSVLGFLAEVESSSILGGLV